MGVGVGRGVAFSPTATLVGDGAGTEGRGFAVMAGSVCDGDGVGTTGRWAGTVTFGSGTETFGGTVTLGAGWVATGTGRAAPVPMKSSVTQTVPPAESTTPTPTVVKAGSRMFLRCSGEFMNAWAMESQVGPVPTFSPSACQLDGASW